MINSVSVEKWKMREEKVGVNEMRIFVNKVCFWVGY